MATNNEDGVRVGMGVGVEGVVISMEMTWEQREEVGRSRPARRSVPALRTNP